MSMNEIPPINVEVLLRKYGLRPHKGLGQNFLQDPLALEKVVQAADIQPTDTVLEIAFDKLQPSNRHSSGLAMRFPRILRIRTDKTPADIDTIESARRLVTS